MTAIEIVNMMVDILREVIIKDTLYSLILYNCALLAGNVYGFSKKWLRYRQQQQTPTISESVTNLKIMHTQQSMPYWTFFFKFENYHKH